MDRNLPSSTTPFSPGTLRQGPGQRSFLGTLQDSSPTKPFFSSAGTQPDSDGLNVRRSLKVRGIPAVM
ncbi:hypothetical protein PBY51_014541 [Eleginops maclovinus]|uniref:Uncharacterized protein n=1 Tax=Eleginops maclovinus TaxID=56733 RepID=A0AAN7WNF9_ELEMC|nr:hypothetical protein PBY51_014541 [Eleginops maclovinus]